MELKNIAHYKLGKKLGEGGMGAVYQAEDTRLGREVALKFINAGVSDRDHAHARFLREARAVAALDHPNICTIFEIGEDNGHTYLAMAIVDGPSLSRLLRNGRLPVRKSIEIAAQVAAGLAEAHRKGIVHRDIKPGNILLNSRGVVKIVDFGLAALGGEDRITRDGSVLGTPAYMSPEQWQGLDPDPRSDIWALGVVLFEMVTGQPAFTRSEGRAVSWAILNQPLPPLRQLRPDAPETLARLVSQMLAKDPASRLQTADEVETLLLALDHSNKHTEAVSADPSDAITMAVHTVKSIRSVTQVSRASEIPTIAVLPFVNTGGDPENEYFADGITDELIAGLARIRVLKVVSRASAFRFKGSHSDPRDIARQLSVRYLVTGSLRRMGDRLRMTAELVSAEDGFSMWSEVYQREVRDVFAIQEELSGSILAALRIQLSAVNPFAGAARANPDLPAYQLYLKGLFHWNRRTQTSMLQAVECYEKAIELDPLYLQPYSGLADALMLTTLFAWDTPRRTMPRAKQVLLKALEIDPRHAESHFSMAMTRFLYDWDTVGASGDFSVGLELQPHYAIGRAFHAHFMMWTGDYQRANLEMQEALVFDPLSINAMTNQGWFFFYQRRFEDAETALISVLELDPAAVRANMYLGAAQSYLGKHRAAIESTRRAAAASPLDLTLQAWLASALALAGQTAEAREILAVIESRAETVCVSPLDLALPYGALGDVEQAAALMEQAIAGRWPVTVFLGDPRLDPVRRHPRLVAALEAAGLSLL